MDDGINLNGRHLRHRHEPKSPPRLQKRNLQARRERRRRRMHRKPSVLSQNRVMPRTSLSITSNCHLLEFNDILWSEFAFKVITGKRNWETKKFHHRFCRPMFMILKYGQNAINPNIRMAYPLGLSIRYDTVLKTKNDIITC